jgi:hypothetical protein
VRREPRQVYRVFDEEQFLSASELDVDATADAEPFAGGRSPLGAETSRERSGGRRMGRAGIVAVLAAGAGVIVATELHRPVSRSGAAAGLLQAGSPPHRLPRARPRAKRRPARPRSSLASRSSGRGTRLEPAVAPLPPQPPTRTQASQPAREFGFER